MPNLIYRGPVGAIPQTLNLPLASAATPGVAVTSDATQLALAHDGTAEVFILGTNAFIGQGVDQPYTAGDTATAYALQSGALYQVRMAAGTYAFGQALGVGADGLFTDAGSGRIIAFYRGRPQTLAAQTLTDIVVV